MIYTRLYIEFPEVTEAHYYEYTQSEPLILRQQTHRYHLSLDITKELGFPISYILCN